MFYHIKELQYRAKPSCPDPAYAKKLQEVLGGQYGEISVMMQYLFQGFNCRADEKYRDLLHDVGTEEIGHVEMLATMISRLLDDAPADVQENAYKSDPAVAAVMGGMNPQHAIVAGLGAMAADAEGYPWNAKYIISSGNLLADFRANLNAESQGRLQVTRLYAMTDDPGVRDMLSFLIARDTYHQNMWYAAIKELEERERDIVVPVTFPRELEKQEVSYDLFNFSRGDESSQGRWARGEAFDGRGEFSYISAPVAFASAPHLKPAPMWLHNTLPPMSKC
ncbi:MULTISPECIES: manganese catalase family protein [Bacillus]|uniref:Manganese catalase family protein n=1 Tax=Bacillus velezensis TaxID=492670 RepID=A0ABC8D362_BACVE|nr:MULTISPECIES: manganese catalase family protein [Bacillus]ANB46327.1 manganese catalase [Bacillus velezensis]AVI28034.1 manganese catalase [Bacillus velezensis]AWX71686.1 manganese catalase family protein [Bacillus velezensis]KMO08109.1 manganese catalase [Bacillus amyloliquefaciens]MBR7814839.1 manganese catalase family protein [Bacillus sp. CCNWLCWHY013]